MANAAIIAASAMNAAQQAAAWSAAVKQTNALWAPYAQARGFYFGMGRVGWGHDRMPRLEGATDGVRVALELVGYSYIAVLATPPAPLPGHVGVTRTGMTSKLAALLGAKRLTFGDPHFDQMYEVDTTDPELARRVVSPLTRAEMPAMDAYSLAYDSGEENDHHPIVSMYIRAIPQTPQEIDRAFHVVVEIARLHPETAPYR